MNSTDLFPGELEVLLQYSTINELAESLYDERGSKNEGAFSDLNKLHHCKEDIASYFKEVKLQDLIPLVKGVLFQENLNADFERVFRVSTAMSHEKKIGNSMPTKLTSKAQKNLIKALSADYEIIDRLVASQLIDLEFWKSIDRRRV